jgi:hypothetical protein
MVWERKKGNKMTAQQQQRRGRKEGRKGLIMGTWILLDRERRNDSSA